MVLGIFWRVDRERISLKIPEVPSSNLDFTPQPRTSCWESRREAAGRQKMARIGDAPQAGEGNEREGGAGETWEFVSSYGGRSRYTDCTLYR